MGHLKGKALYNALTLQSTLYNYIQCKCCSDCCGTVSVTFAVKMLVCSVGMAHTMAPGAQ